MLGQSEINLQERRALPTGVRLASLATHLDSRGELSEIFRNEWHDSPAPVQWIISRTAANVLRGVHAHARHWDYRCVVAGETFVGLHDLRGGQPAADGSAMLRLTGERLQMLVIPPGVAHGLYSPGQSVQLLGASGYYDSSDHRRCRWDSAELALDWPCTAPELSAADRDAGSYAALRACFLSRT